MNLDGKVAVVTGSGRGIGKAIALRLATLGADLVINFFRNRAPAEATAEEIRGLGRRAVVVRADVGGPKGIGAVLKAAEKAFGGLDILICNAASGYNRPVMEQKLKGWDWTMNINARSALFMAQGAVPLMRAPPAVSMTASTQLACARAPAALAASRGELSLVLAPDAACDAV